MTFVTCESCECTCTDLTLTNCKLQSRIAPVVRISEITSGNRIVDTSCVTSPTIIPHFVVFFHRVLQITRVPRNAIADIAWRFCKVLSVAVFRVNNSVVEESFIVEKLHISKRYYISCTFRHRYHIETFFFYITYCMLYNFVIT